MDGGRATHSVSSWRKPGPITPSISRCPTLERRSRSQSNAVVMGPCFRRDDDCGCRSRHTFSVVLAKARTHYPKSQLLHDAGATIRFITDCGGYGSWLSPGRRGRRRAASPHHPANPFICGTRQPPRPAAFPASKFPFGNLALTMISVWLGSECRVKSPRFDMLAGEAGPGFGRAPHATDARGFRAVSPRLMRPWNRCRLAARLMGTLALRGYCR